jgi:hypothetical protein
MPKNRNNSRRKEAQAGRRSRQRHISVRSELLKEPDVNKIARAVVALALAQAEKEAAEQKAQEEDASHD